MITINSMNKFQVYLCYEIAQKTGGLHLVRMRYTVTSKIILWIVREYCGPQVDIIINDSNQTLDIIILNCILNIKFPPNSMRNQHCALSQASPSPIESILKFTYEHTVWYHHSSGLAWWMFVEHRSTKCICGDWTLSFSLSIRCEQHSL